MTLHNVLLIDMVIPASQSHEYLQTTCIPFVDLYDQHTLSERKTCIVYSLLLGQASVLQSIQTRAETHADFCPRASLFARYLLHIQYVYCYRAR